MYDFIELRQATDALWSAIAARLPNAPPTLTRGVAPEKIWTDPGLLLAQTCGYPLVTKLKGRVALVATPIYRAAGCQGAYYRSAVIVRAADPADCAADLRGRVCAVNDAASNSGMNLLRSLIAPLAGNSRFFGEVILTGAHEASVRAVADGRADVAAIDCISWAHLQRLRPAQVAGLRVLAWTEASPGLPLITSITTAPKLREALAEALRAVASDPVMAPLRAELLLEGFAFLPMSAYQAVLDMERSAYASGYPELK
jgi:ABC-type phosphate/phosphonate transport system substrate-binding protein